MLYMIQIILKKKNINWIVLYPLFYLYFQLFYLLFVDCDLCLIVLLLSFICSCLGTHTKLYVTNSQGYTHDKDQLCVWLQKSRGAELLVDWCREMRWCQHPGYCPRKNFCIAALLLLVCPGRSSVYVVCIVIAAVIIFLCYLLGKFSFEKDINTFTCLNKGKE